MTCLRSIHDFELALLDPCLAMSERGVRIDDAQRRSMIDVLVAEREPLIAETRTFVVNELLLGLLNARKVSKPHLFREKWTCPCCRNGRAKRAACWSCVGFSKKPTKKQLVGLRLVACGACAGAGQRTDLTFNPDSPEQVKAVLYELLRLPKRIKDGKLRSDEDALKDLLSHTNEGEPGRTFIQALLRITKAGTIREILERIAPGPDGRIRSFYNPAGTETGRFSSAESFVVASTNLQNMPKREATDPRFDVRACFVADPGHVLVEADLSGAEAWVTAACCGDRELLARLADGVDLHCWTAAHIFGKPINDITKMERHLGKVARHALNYGMQWQTFQRNVNAEADRTGVAVTATQAKAICKGYHALHPGLEQWWHAVQREVVARKTLTTCFGRRRTFFGRAASVWLSETHREAIAFEPQSTIADLLNRGLLRWWRQYDGKHGELLLQIHDAVMIQVPQARVSLAASLLRRCLAEPLEVHGCRITIPADVQAGENWAQLKPVGA